MRQPNLSLRTELILLLGALVLLATISVGSIAFTTSRTIIERSAVGELGIAANARKQQLLQFLTQQRARAAAVLETASLGCAPDETPCLRRVLMDFVSTERATTVQLRYHSGQPITAGERAGASSLAPPSANQIARFGRDRDGRSYYVISVEGVTRDGPMMLTLRGGSQVIDQIFLDRLGLGQSGETFLTDTGGYFLTPPRYPAQAGENRPMKGKAVQSCLGGNDAEVLDQDYRGVPAIYGFRHVPEIGGGCVIALIDQSEAFAPTARLRSDVAKISVILAGIAIACSFLFAQLVSRPMDRLRHRARTLQAGDFDSPVPVRGPSEVRTFAQTFAAMARSLRDSRLALEVSNEQIKNILESISDGFLAFDREWRCTYINDRAADLTRIPRVHLLGGNLWQLLPPRLAATFRADLERAMSERTHVRMEKYYAPFDTWFEVDAYPTRDGLAVFGRDVTEQKRIAERLQQTQKLESLGVLAGGIAHDFNNLLTGIIGNASIALEDLPPDHIVRSYLENTINAGERAATLTRQLLAYAGKGRFVIQALNLSSLVREIGTLLQASLPGNVQLRLELDDALPPIEGDAAQLQQLIMNLVINGAEAISDSNIGTVRVITRLQEIDQEYIRTALAPTEIGPGKYVTLEVHDNGSGMDEATLARIFDPFFTTKFAGRGLGLAAAMGIVRGHSGALQVYSVPGNGSTFNVLFPAGQGEAVENPAAEIAADLAGTGTILVIDDEDVVRRAATSALERYGYNVVVADNGKQGVDLFRRLGDTVSLVLLDMTMDVMSGEEALAHLKLIREDVPIILSSGYSEMEATRRFTGKGLAGFIQKPYTAAHLGQYIKLALRPKVPLA